MGFAKHFILIVLSWTTMGLQAQKADSLPPVIGSRYEPLKRVFPKDVISWGHIERNPEFKGGMKAMYEFILQNLQYPKVAKENKVQGTVYVGFIVGLQALKYCN